MKRSLIAAMAAMILCTILSFTAFAYEEYMEDDTSRCVDVRIELAAPDSFSEDITVYLNQIPCYLSHGESGYGISRKLEPGTYKVGVISTSDMEGRYSYQYEDIFEAVKGAVLRIIVSDAGEMPEEEIGHADDEMIEEHPVMNSNTITVPEYDFTDLEATESGRLHVSCSFCSAIKSVTYSLKGAEIIDIELSRENDFEAYATVKPGAYREMSLTHIELDEDATDAGYTFTFSHADNPNFYGNTYTVEDGKTVKITDLKIMMDVGGYPTEASADFLFTPTLMENYNSAREAKIESQMAEIGMDKTDEHVQETIAEAVPVIKEEPEEIFDITRYLGLIIIAVMVLGITMSVLFIRRAIKNKED